MEDLGQLPKQSKGKLGRKQQRQQKRQQIKQNRAQHFSNAGNTNSTEGGSTPAAGITAANGKGKKRATNDDEPARESTEPTSKRAKIQPVTASQSTSTQTLPSAPIEPPRKQTALEKMLEKQQRQANGGVVPARLNRSNAESVEDREIAWLEAKLGMRGPVSGVNKDELVDDGLDGKVFTSQSGSGKRANDDICRKLSLHRPFR